MPRGRVEQLVSATGARVGREWRWSARGARVPVAPATPWLSFHLAGEEYALELPQVREIVRYENVTRVPRASACLRGVLNLRGLAVPVIDVAAGWGWPEVAATPRTCIVVVEAQVADGTALMGLVVEAVGQVLEPRAQDIDAAPSHGTRVPASVLKGMLRRDAQPVLLLALERVLSEGLSAHPLPTRQREAACGPDGVQ